MTIDEFLEDRVKWWREHAEALDRNWSTLHNAAMSPIRSAVGLPDGSVPEIVAAVERLKAENAELRKALVERENDGD